MSSSLNAATSRLNAPSTPNDLSRPPIRTVTPLRAPYPVIRSEAVKRSSSQ